MEDLQGEQRRVRDFDHTHIAALGPALAKRKELSVLSADEVLSGRALRLDGTASVDDIKLHVRKGATNPLQENAVGRDLRQIDVKPRHNSVLGLSP